MHAANWHKSLPVQAFPSSQGSTVGVNLHPAPVTQASVVQGLPSVHGIGCPTHLPWSQVSCSVQSSPSSHVKFLNSCLQSAVLSQVSRVQPSPSLHGSSFGVATQPTPAWQASTVHVTPSSQFAGPPGLQPLPAHLSPTVQTSPSSQVASLGRCTQPCAPPHESSVQRLPSPQSTASSVVPSQSLSSPSQRSAEGVIASQAVNPSAVQRR